MPALVKVLVVFAAIVILNRLKLDLGLSIFAGAVLLGLWFHLGFAATGIVIGRSLIEPTTLVITLLVVLILSMNRMMEMSGLQKRMVDAFAGKVASLKLSLVAFPALIGLLPMPGGAYFSAPMVGEISRDLAMTAEKKTAVNYWFRHIWEFWWPMYPGVILAVTLTGWGLPRFVLVQSVYTPLCVAAGILFLLRGVRKDGQPAPQTPAGGWGGFLVPAMPILVILACVIVLSAASPLWEGRLVSGPMAQYTPMFTGLALANLMTAKSTGSLKKALSAFLSLKILWLALLVLSIMAYKNVLNESGAVSAISAELNQYRIPVFAVVMILPFISGMVIGVAIGFVGASFPLVLSLTQDLPAEAAYITLAYGMGWVGMMLSPIHFCLVLTKDYYKAAFGGVYRFLIPLCGVLALAVLAWAAILSFL